MKTCKAFGLLYGHVYGTQWLQPESEPFETALKTLIEFMANGITVNQMIEYDDTKDDYDVTEAEEANLKASKEYGW